MNYDRLLTRVWDKQEKKMIYPGDYIDGDCKFLACNSRHIITKPTVSSLKILSYIPFGDRFVPMQCTGLKDKNGKLIYEGDIIAENTQGNNHTFWRVICWKEGHLRAAWIKEGFWRDEECSLPLIDAVDLKLDKIIGNIYENEKLLEGKA